MTPDFDPLAFQITNDTTLPGLLRCLKARRLREGGSSDEEIAAIVRLPVHLVQVAIDAAEDRHPPINGEDLTTAAYYLYQQQLERLNEVARNPGFKHDVKGALMEGPDGQPEIDTQTQIAAEREISRGLESIRKLMGSDAPVRRHLSIEDIGRRDRALMLVQQLRLPAAAALDVVDGEVVYDPEGPSLALGDGGVQRDDLEDDGE